MQKRTRAIVIAAIFTIGAILLSLRLNMGGDINNVKRTIPHSEIYSEQDISEAMDLVEEQFNSGFRGCTLTALWYTEDAGIYSTAEWAAQYHKDEAIVLLSTFNVDSSGGDGTLDPNSTYTDWEWILVRDKGSSTWELSSWGYG